jgi:hypothetical protein
MVVVVVVVMMMMMAVMGMIRPRGVYEEGLLQFCF